MLKTKWIFQPPLLIPPPSSLFSNWLSSYTILQASWFTLPLWLWTDSPGSDLAGWLHYKAFFFLRSAVHHHAVKFLAVRFMLYFFLDRAGMSVFTAIVGIRLSYRDNSRHGNQGWCMVLSHPWHILKHWELVWKRSSLKIKMWQSLSLILGTFSSNRSYFCFISLHVWEEYNLCFIETPLCHIFYHNSCILWHKTPNIAYSKKQWLNTISFCGV